MIESPIIYLTPAQEKQMEEIGYIVNGEFVKMPFMGFQYVVTQPITTPIAERYEG